MGLSIYLKTGDKEVYDGNITHNLNEMASKASLYWCMWRPSEMGFILAKDIIDQLRYGLQLLRSNPAYYKQYDASNGWGVYDNLIDFVQRYLNACTRYPNSKIEVSR